MKIINFSYEEKINSPITVNDGEKEYELNMINICQVINILNKTHIGNVSKTIDPELEIFAQGLINEIKDSFIFSYEIIQFVNKNNTNINNIKSTLLNVFNNKIKNEVDLDMEAVGDSTLEHLPFATKNIKKEDGKTLYINADNYCFDDLVIDKETNYIIEGQNSYEAEFLYWTLKNDHKVTNVLNMTDNTKILEYYEKQKTQNKDFKYLDLSRLVDVLSNFEPYKIQNYPLTHYVNMIDNIDNNMFGFIPLIELTGVKYQQVLLYIIQSIMVSAENNDFDKYKKYILMFVTQFHIIDKNFYQNFSIYMNFLDAVKNTITVFNQNFDKEIDVYKYNFILKYQSYCSTLKLSNVDRDSLFEEIYIELKSCKYREGNIKQGINNLCSFIELPFDMWNSILRHKSNLNTSYSHQVITQLKDFYFDNGQDFPDIKNDDISNSILSLCNLSFKIIRTFSLNNKWFINNPFIEIIIQKLGTIKDYYMSNIDNFNNATITRITSIVSSYHSLILRYNFDNNKVDSKILLNNFHHDIKTLYDKDVCIQYEGAIIKLMEDLGKLQLMANHYDYKIDLYEFYMSLYYNVNNVIEFFYDYDITLYNEYNRPNVGKFMTAFEHGRSIFSAAGILEKNVISLKNKNVDAITMNHMYVNELKSYLGIFQELSEIDNEYTNEEYYMKITKSSMDWELIY